MVDPLQNPGISPTEPLKGPDLPSVGAGDALEPKPFSLPPEPLNEGTGVSQPGIGKPTPMKVAEDAAKEQRPWDQEMMGQKLEHLQNVLTTARRQLGDPDKTKNLSPDHYTALGMLVDKMNPQAKNIAKYSNVEFVPVQKKSGDSILGFVTNWLNGLQGSIGASIQSVNNMKSPDPAQMLRLQMAVNRATERAETFSTIVGSTVSGIKTLMSTQLG